MTTTLNLMKINHYPPTDKNYFKEGLEQIYANNLRTNGEFYVDNMIEPLIQMGYKCKIFESIYHIIW